MRTCDLWQYSMPILGWPDLPTQSISIWWVEKQSTVIQIVFCTFCYHLQEKEKTLSVVLFHCNAVSDAVGHKAPPEGLETGLDPQAEPSQFTVQVPSMGQKLFWQLCLWANRQTNRLTSMMHEVTQGSVLGSLSVRLHAQLSQITAIVRLRCSIRQLQLSEYTCQWENLITGRSMSYPGTIGGAILISTSGNTATSVWPLYIYAQGHHQRFLSQFESCCSTNMSMVHSSHMQEERNILS